LEWFVLVLLVVVEGIEEEDNDEDERGSFEERIFAPAGRTRPPGAGRPTARNRPAATRRRADYRLGYEVFPSWWAYRSR
jgi:hypothetical protein